MFEGVGEKTFKALSKVEGESLINLAWEKLRIVEGESIEKKSGKRFQQGFNQYGNLWDTDNLRISKSL